MKASGPPPVLFIAAGAGIVLGIFTLGVVAGIALQFMLGCR